MKLLLLNRIDCLYQNQDGGKQNSFSTCYDSIDTSQCAKYSFSGQDTKSADDILFAAVVLFQKSLKEVNTNEWKIHIVESNDFSCS